MSSWTVYNIYCRYSFLWRYCGSFVPFYDVFLNVSHVKRQLWQLTRDLFCAVCAGSTLTISSFRLKIHIKVMHIFFPGDVPWWDWRNFRCNWTITVCQNSGTIVQTNFEMCIQSSLSGMDLWYYNEMSVGFRPCSCLVHDQRWTWSENNVRHTLLPSMKLHISSTVLGIIIFITKYILIWHQYGTEIQNRRNLIGNMQTMAAV